MQIKFPHGREEIRIDFPEGSVAKIFEVKASGSLTGEEIKKSLELPAGSRKLNEVARGRKDAVIVISDITRYIPYQAFLPFLLSELEAGGIKPGRVSFLVATGCHRPATPEEIDKILGKEIARRYRVLNHSAFDQDGLVSLGKTRKGTPIWVNKFYARSDLKILTGLIEPHFMAGFSGGRKAICPGISGYDTVKIVHSPRFLESVNVRNGVLRNNQFHREVTEVAGKAGSDFIVNVTLNKEKNVAGIFCGNYRASFLNGCRFCREQTSAFSRKRVDLAVTSGGGYPLDLTFYQTIKGIVTAGEIVRDGGTVLAISGMKEGLGSKNFISLMEEYRGPENFLERYSKPVNFTLDQWQIEELFKVTRRATVCLYSRNKMPELIENLGVKIVRDPESFLAPFFSGNASIGLLPEGPFVLPKICSK
ncbi:MAG: nickel-dependent lactate racemase [Candidatus Omnitrophica bacterium]|nr:nickel-dependent lactate racemase [Candidatus Omnitrophota bacterium]